MFGYGVEHVCLQSALCLATVWNMLVYSLHYVWLQCETCLSTVWNMFIYSVHCVWLQCGTCLSTVCIVFGYNVEHVHLQSVLCLATVQIVFVTTAQQVYSHRCAVVDFRRIVRCATVSVETVRLYTYIHMAHAPGNMTHSHLFLFACSTVCWR